MSLYNRQYSNVAMQQENDFNIISENIDIWHGDFPFKKGDAFPPDKLKERANVSLTNNLLYDNDYMQTFNFITMNPAISDPITGTQSRQIVANLPYFKMIVDAWISLCCIPLPLIDTIDSKDVMLSELVGNSNLNEVIQSAFKSLFLDTIDAYKVTTDIMGRPTIHQIPSKNMIVYNSPEYINSICCVLVFSIINDRVEFIEYWYNGKIVKRIFKYSSGIIGDQIGEPIETEAFGGKYQESPVVVIKHNVKNLNDTYGVDQFRYWDGGIAAICRSVVNLLRQTERLVEIIRKVPEGALERLSDSSYGYVNRGIITFPDGAGKDQIPDIEYIIPQLKDNIEATLMAVEKMTKILSSVSGISPIWFDFEKLGSNLSAKSIQAAMLPTILNANRICANMTSPVKEIVRKIGLLGNLELNNSDIDVCWFAGVDDDETLNDIMDIRIKNGTISEVDAIKKQDKVSTRVAMERVSKIRGAQNNTEVQSNGEQLPAELNKQDDSFTVGSRDDNKEEHVNSQDVKTGASYIKPDYQLAIQPTDITG